MRCFDTLSIKTKDEFMDKIVAFGKKTFQVNLFINQFEIFLRVLFFSPAERTTSFGELKCETTDEWIYYPVSY